MYVIIPDIHGDYYQLAFTLRELGFVREITGKNRGVWRHPDNFKAIFLGDFIDGGKDNGRVLTDVRNMVSAQTGFAIMGNHEINAILYNTWCPIKKNWLRPRSDNNQKQHMTFLAEFGSKSESNDKDRKKLDEILSWFMRLPVFLDFGQFRVVHAQWDTNTIKNLKQNRNVSFGPHVSGAFLKPRDMPEIANAETSFGSGIDRMLKGMQLPLPLNYQFSDYTGKMRSEVRIKWWSDTERTYRKMALSVPDPASLPDLRINDFVDLDIYSPSEVPIFFGHYKMSGCPHIIPETPALCLDYPKTACAYIWQYGDVDLRADRLMVF